MKKLIIKGMDNRYFSSKIVQWYLQNKRDLPWRETADPYKIWLSEIILQQTRVAQGLPYYLNFIKKYPTVHTLAKAREEDVLRLWQGLGYYTRARNLHKCAKTVVAMFDGKFPEKHGELLTLPGIGDYTAAAIASIAFREKVAVVDGNVFRVLARIFGIDTPVNTNEGKQRFGSLANELIRAEERPDLYNQGMMEFGATFCTPVNPSCSICIFQKQCEAFKLSLQHTLPVKIKKKKSRKRYLHYLVVRKGKSLLMKKRIEKDIWQGLYDFPVIENTKQTNLKKILSEATWLENDVAEKGVLTVSETYKHILTHQTIFCKFVIIDKWTKPEPADKTFKFYSFNKISSLPKPVLISRFLDDHKLS